MENANSIRNMDPSSIKDETNKNQMPDYKTTEIKEVDKNVNIIQPEDLKYKDKIGVSPIDNNDIEQKSSRKEKDIFDNKYPEQEYKNKNNNIKSENLEVDKLINNSEIQDDAGGNSKNLKSEKEKSEDKQFVNNVNQGDKNDEIKKFKDLKNEKEKLFFKSIENDMFQGERVEENNYKSQKAGKEKSVGDKLMENNENSENKKNDIQKFDENHKDNNFLKTKINQPMNVSYLNYGENTNNSNLNKNFSEVNTNLKHVFLKNNDTKIIKIENYEKINNDQENNKNKKFVEVNEKFENDGNLKDKKHEKKNETTSRLDKTKIDNKINDIGKNIKDKYDNNDIQEKIDLSDSSSDEDEYNEKYNYQYDSEVCGIRNLGNNCYLNSGLQILASCEELVDFLQKDEYDDLGKILTLFKKAMISIQNRKIYNPKKFINCFCKLNSDFVKGSQCCSQNFIRTIIRNINKIFINKNYELIYENEQYNDKSNEQYENFIKSSKAFPESKVMSIFSGITKSHSYGECPNCKEKIDDYSFSYFIDQNMYLDEFHYRCNFSDVLKANKGNGNTLTMDCPKCNEEIVIKDETKYIKLPNILIFTLERYQGPTNKVSIQPDELLDIGPYTDKSVEVDSTIYELFAVNIRFGSTANFGHEICQVKRKGKWYEINDTYGYEIKNLSNFDCSYGLFYKKKKCQNNEVNYELNNIIKINTSPSQKWFTSIWNFLTTPLYSLFSKEKNDLNYLKQGLYIISTCDTLINELSGINLKYCNLTTITKKTILKIIEQNICDESDFIIEYLKDNKVDNKGNENNLENFISILIYNINDEFLKIKYNLYDENNLKYKPIRSNEIKEYYDLINKIFPQSSILFTFSSIIKNSKYAKCKCGQIFEGFSFEQSIVQKISLDNINSSNFSYILNESFSDKNKKIFCDKCCKKIKSKITKKFIKLGEVLIFTFENKNIKIQPDEIIDLNNYIESSLKNVKTAYELFAMDITVYIKDNIHQHICKIKRYGKWYEIGNLDILNGNQNYNQNIYGLYYKLSK